MTTRALEMGNVGSPESAKESAIERRVVPIGAVVLTTFFGLLYALRGSIALIDRGEDPPLENLRHSRHSIQGSSSFTANRDACWHGIGD